MQMQPSLFEHSRSTMRDAILETADSLNAWGREYRHWAIAYSGGKDSSALLSVTLHLIQTGQVAAPESLTVLYSDTRQELPPLHIGARRTLDDVRRMGYRAEMVQPDLDDRFFVYMLGRGVPPPNNRTLRWCTAQLKIEPMQNALKRARHDAGEKLLMLTGVRMGESAARDSRIAVSCARNNAECGQGWFQETTPAAVADTLAPLLHWRVCHVWDWLTFEARRILPAVELVAEVYGGDEAEEINARTGCIGCPLATRDLALDNILKMPKWAFLAPLKRLRPLYEELRAHRNRKQKNGERNANGRLSANPCRKGPLTLQARRDALETVLGIQAEINRNAPTREMMIDLINSYEEARIRELIVQRTWPRRWSDADPDATELIPQTYHDGNTQNLLFGSDALHRHGLSNLVVR